MDSEAEAPMTLDEEIDELIQTLRAKGAPAYRYSDWLIAKGAENDGF